MKRFVLPLLAILYLAGCSDSNTSLEQELKAAVTEGEAGPKGYKTVKLTELTDFEWDKVYYFQPNENKWAISDVIGFRWEGDDIEPNHRRLLFVKGEEVVSYTDYDYTEFPLFVYGCQNDRWIYPSSRSEFATFKYCIGEQEVYTFIPVACAEDIRELMEYECAEKTE
ncbi:hypothetical protein ABID22_001773 [Pontibacter aydingkolensis]|uniref:Membrane lipoprotein lipid attachment site-containing protein n=1 Tax=Pontibacter aydingkolensis TaxID=1911536 RepID=A0ABS7CPT8_9BACT|nr:membrane lipoprotein lipid attachment site-containing protein [Pontibacter aydingkolensis]MBW7465839.1 membrane lipoprotein lipid attachment site-containing protein [Pontibacter aydingkolensis]